MRFEEIENELVSRNIEYLYHFTHRDNLPLIMEYGLQSKEWLENNGFKTYGGRSESVYYEGYEDTISLSFSFPNWQMLYSLMCENGLNDIVIIEMSVEILLEKEFILFSKNASQGHGAYETNDISNLFNGSDRSATLDDRLTTDPQAEIRVYGEVTGFENILVRSALTEIEVSKQMKQYGVNVELNKYAFDIRRGRPVRS